MPYKPIQWDDEALGKASQALIHKIEALVNGQIGQLSGETAFNFAPPSNIEVGDKVMFDGLQVALPTRYYGIIRHIDNSDLATFSITNIEDVSDPGIISMDEEMSMTSKSLAGVPTYGVGDSMTVTLASLTKMED